MARRLFGARKSPDLAGRTDWPQLPGALLPVDGAAGSIALPPPPPPPLLGRAIRSQESVAPEEELLERIAAFRTSVADSLYEGSKDYQVLCNLTQADLTACDDIIAELRRRLAGNVHYEVLAKLDDAHALVAARLGEASSPGSPQGGE